MSIRFACDEGVKCNFVRTGAKDGPVAIKNSLAFISWHRLNNIKLMDVTNASAALRVSAPSVFGLSL